MAKDKKPIENPEKFGPSAKMALKYINNFVEYIREDLDFNDKVARARTMQLIFILNTLQSEMINKMRKYYDLDNIPEATLIEDESGNKTENGAGNMAINLLNERLDNMKDELTGLIFANSNTIEIGKTFLTEDFKVSELEALKIKKLINKINEIIKILNTARDIVIEYQNKKV